MIVKKTLIVLALVLTGAAVIAQNDLPKESKIIKNSVKSIVVSKSDFETGKEDKYTSEMARYNSAGQIIEYKEWDENKKFVRHERYEYNADGEKTKETQMNASGAVIKINEYKYQGKLLKERISYLPNGKIKSKKTLTYEFFE